MNATDLSRLEGSVVLVCSAQDHRNPPSGVRGTIHVHEAGDAGHPVIAVELQFPQMFTTRAHRRTIILNDEEIARLLGSEDYGAFTVTVNDRLDPEAPRENE